MNYELCKKLKDAGFPQKQPIYIPDSSFDTDKGFYIPTLSELIEECGGGFKFQLTRAIEGWYASMRGCEGTGETTEEAVANLWLELNKKI